MIDFYKNAPQKRRGRIPFGVQHGTYLNTEERVRRAVREWSACSGSNASGALPANASNAEVSYKELVESFQVGRRRGFLGGVGGEGSLHTRGLSGILGGWGVVNSHACSSMADSLHVPGQWSLYKQGQGCM
jgi:hypothetical protein